MEAYKTISKSATAEQIIERSRFIAYTTPVSSIEESESFFEQIRKKHRDATHNVPAYVIGDNMQNQWAGDDGEPRGTSGAPILHMLVNECISDVAVVVTRYFGGTKLGTGGLVRAYTSSARMAIDAAGLSKVCEQLVINCSMDYNNYNKIEGYPDKMFTIENADFTDKVTMSIALDPSDRVPLIALFAAIAPTTNIIEESIKIIKVDIK